MFPKLSRYFFLAYLALRAGAIGTFLDFVVYRTPAALWWKKRHGHSFHKSTIVWFKDGDGIHTRLVFLLSRTRIMNYPNLESIDMDFEFYSEGGQLVKKWSATHVPITDTFVLDSQRLPEGVSIKKPFSGSLLVKQRLGVDDREVQKREGLFSSTSTFIDYYREGSFVTSLHDYCAFLPDQGMNYGSLGMIPAYCDARTETFLIFHAAKPGIGSRDFEIRLCNKRGEKKSVWFTGLAPFAMRRVLISEIFPDAGSFLQGQVGQVIVEGFFRQLLRRIAFGTVDRPTGSLSIDHCFYSTFDKKPSLPAAQRKKMAKGWFNPFLLIEDDQVETSAVFFQNAQDPDSKKVDLIVYDAAGKHLFQVDRCVELSGDAVHRLHFRPLLEERGVTLPFVGHAELLYHEEPTARSYPNDLDIVLEYTSDGKQASAIIGSAAWNPPKELANKKYKSVMRVVCNAAQTTYLAISNCSYDYDYHLEVGFTLTLLTQKGAVAQGRFTVGPNATIYKPIEEFFPDAERLLVDHGGVALAQLTDVNCAYLTNLFITQDRYSRALGVEHSLAYFYE